MEREKLLTPVNVEDEQMVQSKYLNKSDDAGRIGLEDALEEVGTGRFKETKSTYIHPHINRKEFRNT